MSNTDQPFVIVGSGGHAKVVAALLKASGETLLGYVDEDPKTHGKEILGAPVLGNDAWLMSQDPKTLQLANGIGSTDLPELRAKVFDSFTSKGFHFPKLIHPSAWVDPATEVADGAQIMASVTLQPGVRVGKNSIINTSTSIDHDCQIGDHTHVAPGCTLSGTVRVGNFTHIGTGSTVIESIEIGQNVFIGAGSLLIKSVEDGNRVMGHPARARLSQT